VQKEYRNGTLQFNPLDSGGNYSIGADFVGRRGRSPPQSKFCGGDAPAVTREVAPVNHGAGTRDSRGPCQR